MIEGIGVGEVTVRGEAGVVPIFNMVALHFIAAPIGALAVAARLIVAAVWQELVADPAVIGGLHPDIRVLRHGFLV